MPSEKLTLVTPDREFAHTLAEALQYEFDPQPEALTLFEAAGGGWTIDAYYEVMPDTQALRDGLSEMTGRDVPELVRAGIPDENWVALSQAALPPVRAGRFTVYGSHDRERVARGPNAILIDAGEAFGTAHHATTSGCLRAIDRVTRRQPFSRVLDLGCGTGVLAIAVARRLPGAQIMATDLDPQSVVVAASNFAVNAVAGRIAAYCAAGLDHPALRRAAPFDLLIANILAGPLITLSGPIRQAIAPGGTLILSGILNPQAPAVIAAYRAHGFSLIRHDRIAEWTTLELRVR